MRRLINSLGIVFMLILLSQNSYSQNSFDGINYQVRLRDTSGSLPTIVFPFNARITITNGLPTPVFQETHTVNAWNNGLINLVTGVGISTGLGLYTALRDIPFSDSLKIALELDLNGTGYNIIENNFIHSVPMALYSLKNQDTYSSNEMTDADANFVFDRILKYVGGKWISAIDIKSDTALYSINSSLAVTADTAQFALTAVQMNTDTAVYAFLNDTANFAFNTLNSPNADTAYHSTYAQTADTVLYAWYLKGNHTLSSFKIGTLDSTDLVLKTNGLRRIRLSAKGNFYLGIDTSNASFYQNSTKGFLFTKAATITPWNYTAFPISSSFYFRADSAAFRGGAVSGSQWNGVNTTKNSFAFGLDNISGGFRSSIVFGDSCSISQIPPPGAYPATFTNGWGAFAFGHKCQAPGAYSIAVGFECKANMIRNVAMGYQCITGKESANHAIGYRAKATGSTAGSFGYATVASGHKSFAFGNYASTNGFSGSFVYGDASTTDTIKCTANNQFKIRASGGFLFYSDANLTIGAELIAGSGSWSTVSDSLKKNNFRITQGLLPFNISDLKIYDWNYIAQSETIRHIGPTAQSFYRYFKFGECNTKISMVDMDGVILHYIIQELNKTLEMDAQFDLTSSKIDAAIKETDYKDLNKRADIILQKLKSK